MRCAKDCSEMRAIVYVSNTGHTEAYAKMLGDKMGLPVYHMKEAGKILKKETAVLYMGWLFAGQIKGYKQAAKRYAVCCVCGVGLGDTGAQDEMVRKAAKVPEGVPVFTLQGGMDYSRLKGINKFMIDMLVKMLSNKKDRTENETKMLELIKTGGDYVDELHLSNVLTWYERKEKL